MSQRDAIAYGLQIGAMLVPLAYMTILRVMTEAEDPETQLKAVRMLWEAQGLMGGRSGRAREGGEEEDGRRRDFMMDWPMEQKVLFMDEVVLALQRGREAEETRQSLSTGATSGDLETPAGPSGDEFGGVEPLTIGGVTLFDP